MLVHCKFFYQKIASVENMNEPVKSLSRGKAKHFQSNFALKGWSYKNSNANGELIITRIELGINFSILNKTFTFISNPSA